MYTYYIAGFPISDELYHHGIKGQRWGVRRYQNPDGTLTAAGKVRYNIGEFGQNAKDKVSSALGSAKQAASSRIQSIDKDKLKKAAIIGGSAIAAAALAYGGYKLAQANPDMVMYGKYKIRKLLGKTGNNVKADWSDKPGDDPIQKMTKAGFRDIESKYSGRAPSSMNDIINKGTNEAFSKIRDDAIKRSNANYADRINRAEAAAKREQELGRERREILRKQFDDTYKLLKDEQKQMKKKKKSKR